MLQIINNGIGSLMDSPKSFFAGNFSKATSLLLKSESSSNTGSEHKYQVLNTGIERPLTVSYKVADTKNMYNASNAQQILEANYMPSKASRTLTVTLNGMSTFAEDENSDAAYSLGESKYAPFEATLQVRLPQSDAVNEDYIDEVVGALVGSLSTKDSDTLDILHAMLGGITNIAALPESAVATQAAQINQGVIEELIDNVEVVEGGSADA